MPTSPLSPYALQKVIGEQYLQMFTTLYGLETVASATSTSSARGRIRRRRTPASFRVFATALLENRSPTIYGDGEQTRDFTYVANVVDGVLRACEAPRASGEVINVATGGRISLNQLFYAMREVVGGTLEPTYVETREGDVRDSQADIRKAKRAPRLRADRPVRGRPRAHDRVVPHRQHSRDGVASRGVRL